MKVLARALRRNQTDAEKRLWYHLKDRGLAGWKFRRQHPIGPYIVDLVCIEGHLVVELDGGQQAGHGAADEARTAYLERSGFRVLRFWNNDVLANTEGALHGILDQLVPSPLPSPRRRGEGARRSES